MGTLKRTAWCALALLCLLLPTRVHALEPGAQFSYDTNRESVDAFFGAVVGFNKAAVSVEAGVAAVSAAWACRSAALAMLAHVKAIERVEIPESRIFREHLFIHTPSWRYRRAFAFPSMEFPGTRVLVVILEYRRNSRRKPSSKQFVRPEISAIGPAVIRS